MENRRANANGPGSHKDNRIGRGHAQQHQSQKRKGRRNGQGIGQRAAVRVVADQRLQDGSGNLEDQGDHADLAKGERIGIAQHRIHGQKQGLQRIVHQVACGHGDKHRKNGAAGNAVFDCGHAGIPECQAPLASPTRSRQPGRRKADMSRNTLLVNWTPVIQHVIFPACALIILSGIAPIWRKANATSLKEWIAVRSMAGFIPAKERPTGSSRCPMQPIWKSLAVIRHRLKTSLAPEVRGLVGHGLYHWAIGGVDLSELRQRASARGACRQRTRDRRPDPSRWQVAWLEMFWTPQSSFWRPRALLH